MRPKNDFPPEFALAAACCRWPLSDGILRDIRTRADSAIDWPVFVQAVKRQRIAGLAWNALTAAAVTLPADIGRELAGVAHTAARLSLALLAETARLQSAFNTANVFVMVVKGAPLSHLAYGSFSIKHSRDIDLFVAPDDVQAALQLLENSGYGLKTPSGNLGERQLGAVVRYGRELVLLHRDSNLLVELKWKFADNPMLLQGVDAASPTESVSLPGGVEVRILAERDRFAYLCVHGAHHDWFRLKWLADLNALVAPRAQDEVVSLYRHAQSIGAGLCAGQALLLCHRILDLPLPAALLNELQSSGRIEALVADAMTAMTGTRAAPEIDAGVAGVTHNVVRGFRLGQGLRFFLAQCRIESVGVADVARFNLPPALHFLYPVMRLPRWLWRRAQFAGLLRSGR